eukprot:CAMPEP_0206176614 /NCGR_PEP_ID=MMETSP1474-20131121/58681_1 /ASSEMBLY_ACC=CAM_ASM_001110 /TAXON_ID=97495 /ORGANISM="Imantonia sp., Strain RCC918" /LENGTH=67 /DNA_ID=CAMNT_0053587797 /DNA_START=304 /DNA_END=505 /DNA_ORIENTATION=+
MPRPNGVLVLIVLRGEPVPLLAGGAAAAATFPVAGGFLGVGLKAADGSTTGISGFGASSTGKGAGSR